MGRPNRKTCSILCRRTLEGKRQFWDRQFAYVRFCESNATWELHSPSECANWQKKADEIKVKLLERYGERP